MRTLRWSIVGLSLVTTCLVAVPEAAAITDTTAPTVPQNLQALPARGTNPVLAWDAATDDSGAIYHYWVLVDGQQRARPAGTTYDLQTLVNLCRITPGEHRITVQAVDRALNRSAPSNGVQVTVVGNSH